MLVTSGALTVSVEEPFEFPYAAVIIVFPAACVLTVPNTPTVATLVLNELQFAIVVTSSVLWSEYVAVAVNC